MGNRATSWTWAPCRSDQNTWVGRIDWLLAPHLQGELVRLPRPEGSGQTQAKQEATRH